MAIQPRFHHLSITLDVFVSATGREPIKKLSGIDKLNMLWGTMVLGFAPWLITQRFANRD
jgi:hypothetical protein